MYMYTYRYYICTVQSIDNRRTAAGKVIFQLSDSPVFLGPDRIGSRRVAAMQLGRTMALLMAWLMRSAVSRHWSGYEI